MNHHDFEIRLGNVIDVDIDVWQEDHKELEQMDLFEEEECNF